MLTILKLFLVLLLLQKCCLAENDREALLALKAGFKNSFLDGNWTGPLCYLDNTTSWYGIECSAGRVVRIFLENLGLAGEFRPDSLASFTELHSLSFKNNSLSGNLMDFSNNRKLGRVDLSGNRFEGKIPDSLMRLPFLESLEIHNNNLVGPVPELIVSRRNLSGKIPIIKRFKIVSHAENGTSRGQPKDSGSDDSNKPAKKTLSLLILVAVLVIVVVLFLSLYYYKKSKNLEAELMMIKNNKSNNKFAQANKDHHQNQNHQNLIQKSQNLNHSQNEVDQSGERKIAMRENISTTTTISTTESTERSNGGGEAERGKLTFLDSDLRIELDDLLKASAEGLGKGNFGNCYKAMLEQGPTVVVKRLRDLRALSREEFVAHVKSIAHNKHPNLLPLLGYYYANDEKLLLYKFAPNGNLYTRIHRAKGKRERIPFRWNARLSVARAVARAVEYLHLHSTPQETGNVPPHGNLKSTNVLLDETDVVLLTDYGLSSLVAPPIAAQRMVSYRSPEFQTYKKVSPKSDVWSYGCLLLELLTGRVSSHSAPAGVTGADLCSWVHRAVREEWTAEIFDAEIAVQRSASQGLLRLLQIAIRCCDRSPEKRPEMSDVVREVEMIKVKETEDEDDLSLTDNSASQTPSQ